MVDFVVIGKVDFEFRERVKMIGAGDERGKLMTEVYDSKVFERMKLGYSNSNSIVLDGL